MSYSLNVRGRNDELATMLDDAFEKAYPKVAEKVDQHVSAAINAVEALGNALEDGEYSVTLSGHAQQKDDSTRSSFSLSVHSIIT